MSNESGRYEVYAEPFRRDGERVRVSVDGGGEPKWRGDGREIFYASPAGRVMAVAVRIAADRLEVGLPAELFQLARFRPSGEFDDYAVSGDGQRFLAKLPIVQEKESGLELHGVANWTSLLK
jgi:eukaryotic-like serine/threonine-protein kinase